MKNRRFIVLTSILLLPSVLVFCQARETSVMIDKENRNAVSIAVPQNKDVSTDALQQRLQRAGLKEKPMKGIAIYKGVVLSEISPDKLDIYTKVEEGPNNSSVVYMAVSKGYNNFTNSGSDSVLTDKVKTFLESFVPDASNFSAELGISGQMEDLKKLEKSGQRLTDEQKDLQKKKTNLENRLREIDNELRLNNEQIEKKKSELEEAKTKRGNGKG